MYRIWYSTKSFADYIIDNTKLKGEKIVKAKLCESDANKKSKFYKMPDHIRKILYLDAPDVIVEKNNEPIFSVEVSAEAGTGHNAFQRLARITAAIESNVPAFYIYPEGKIIHRKKENKKKEIKWDPINPLVFETLEDMMNIHQIPALLYYFPTDDIKSNSKDPTKSPHYNSRGLIYDDNKRKYPACPDGKAKSMKDLFEALNLVISLTENEGIKEARTKLLNKDIIKKQRKLMKNEFSEKSNSKASDDMSPLTAVKEIDTLYLLNYLSQYEDKKYRVGELLKSREKTVIYNVNAKFRGDPYTGALVAIDYLKCREGKTFEERAKNLVLVWGEAVIDKTNKSLKIIDNKKSTIKDFFEEVKKCSDKNLLTKDYADLKNSEIPRYFMQVRYGSTYSKRKELRVYSYFADAILFPDGSLWRDA